MKFYKITSETKTIFNNVIVLNELFTVKEAKKNKDYKYIKDNSIIVDINKNNTYWFLGARFESKTV